MSPATDQLPRVSRESFTGDSVQAEPASSAPFDHEPDGHGHMVEFVEEDLKHEKSALFRQPLAVWAVAISSVFAFMGIGLVDPILPAIAQNLQASPAQVSLLFTSYFLITGFAMLITGVISSRIGGKRTLLIGLALIIAFATLSGLSSSVGALIGFRAGWGLGNAMFVATALAVIVGVASGGSSVAIVLYEAALGLGLSFGPLVGGLLGGWYWRMPFFGTAILMVVAFVAIAVLLPTSEVTATKTRFRDPLIALTHKGLGLTAGSGLLYYFGFFTVLSYVPFTLGMGEYGIGAVFFGWGVMVALFSALFAPMIQRRIGSVKLLGGTLFVFALDLIALGVSASFHNVPLIVTFTIVAGALIGTNNMLYTELAMEVSDSPRPVASAGYNFVRWIGGALAPFTAASVGAAFGQGWAFYLAAFVVLAALTVVVLGRSFFESHQPELVG